jgi:hypothetical protein
MNNQLLFLHKPIVKKFENVTRGKTNGLERGIDKARSNCSRLSKKAK